MGADLNVFVSHRMETFAKAEQYEKVVQFMPVVTQTFERTLQVLQLYVKETKANNSTSDSGEANNNNSTASNNNNNNNNDNPKLMRSGRRRGALCV